MSVPVGLNLKINCTTDDPKGNVRLFQRANPFSSWAERVVSPGKLSLADQVFTVVKMGIPDGGQYKCKATNSFGNDTIEWSDGVGRIFIVPSE